MAADHPIPIVDTHVHVVSGDRARYPLSPSGVGTDWYLAPGIDVDGLRSAGATDAVLVQAYAAYSTDNTYVLDAAAATGWPAVVIVDGAASLRRLARDHAEVVRGVRVFAIARGGTIDDDDLWAAAGDLGLPVVVATLPDGLPVLARMLARFPHVPVALDHCGFAYGTGALEPFADAASLSLKVTSIVLTSGGDPRDIVDDLAACFGVDRLLWGSDFPQTHDRTYTELVALAERACSRLAPADRDAFLTRNARRFWPAL